MSKLFTEEDVHNYLLKKKLLEKVISDIGVGGKYFKHPADFKNYFRLNCSILKSSTSNTLYVCGSVLACDLSSQEVYILTSVCVFSEQFILKKFNSNDAVVNFIKTNVKKILQKSLKDSNIPNVLNYKKFQSFFVHYYNNLPSNFSLKGVFLKRKYNDILYRYEDNDIQK